MVLKCVTIDDEPLARECIANYVREVGFLELVGSVNNPLELSKIQEEQEVDLLFLDIQMPRMNGIEFLKSSTNMPMVILTTAFPNYALEGFELDVLDYLLKPVTFNRFFKAVNKVKEQYLLRNQKTQEDSTLLNDTKEHIFIKCDNVYKKIELENILFIESMQNYVTFHTTDGKKHLTLMPLKSVEKRLDNHLFLKVHKSFLVSVTKIDTINNGKIGMGDVQIPLSRNYKNAVMDKVLKNKLWKK
ncbi:LytR/AlgR family response regulator transcription factor [Flavivirga eckloniae]|uniref:DNA-binding response regulator n=1 Tax=Flavivirga eckloniae TaxID=1803846 RepID=A0A2K9PWM9_9FLAO|nr:LytTR family DNA-binding domain-containing protein [Flavivirga eckloniae]AUP80937.1 DNA-binding response regulator [Flavivirga eckloniae]